MHIHDVVAPQTENIDRPAQISAAGIKQLGKPVIGLISDFPETPVHKRRYSDIKPRFSKFAEVLFILQPLAWSAVFGVRT